MAWSSPVHRNSTSLGPQPLPRLESSRFHDLNHLTLRFSSPCGCARVTVRIRRLRVCLHWLLHKTLHTSNQTHSHQVQQFPYPVARRPLRSDVSNVWLSRNGFRCQFLLVHGLLQPQPFHFDVTTFSITQPLCHAMARDRVTVEHKCLRWLSSFVTDAFHQQASCAGPGPCAWNSDSPDDKALTFCVTDHPSSQ